MREEEGETERGGDKNERVREGKRERGRKKE